MPSDDLMIDLISVLFTDFPVAEVEVSTKSDMVGNIWDHVSTKYMTKVSSF